MSILHVQSVPEFEGLLKEETFLVVDFYSEDCPPCEKLAPLYEKMARLFPGVRFVKIFRQQFRSLAESYGVTGSPTIIFFREGQLLEKRLSGDIDETALRDAVVACAGESAAAPAESQTLSEPVDLCIIGNGPAGLTAAVYAARYKVSQVLVGDLPGGMMMSVHTLCTYPSETEISGAALTQKMVDHVTALAVPQKSARAELITPVNGRYHIALSTGEVIDAQTVLLATGTTHRSLGVPHEKELHGRGVSYCATCDGQFFKGKTVAVVGGSDNANTAALFLADIAAKVYLLCPGAALEGEVAWIDHVLAHENISVVYRANVQEIVGHEKVTGIRVDTGVAGSDVIAVDGVFIETGADPDVSLVTQLGLETDQSNYVITSPDQMTSLEGVWAAGDMTTNSNGFRQVVTACAEGAVAAHRIYHYLRNKRSAGSAVIGRP